VGAAAAAAAAVRLSAVARARSRSKRTRSGASLNRLLAFFHERDAHASERKEQC
jgi:hypothetical protein